MKLIFSKCTAVLLAVALLACALLGACAPSPDDPKARTYEDTVYDAAYRARKMAADEVSVYYYFLFNESDHKVLKCVHTNDKTWITAGTYEGTVGESVTVTFSEEDSTQYVFGERKMFTQDELEQYAAVEVASAVSEIKEWK